jgi:hypothetical protein
VTLDDDFHGWLFVPRYDEEPCAIRCDAVVLSRLKLNYLHTPLGRTLAMERKYLLHAVAPRAFLDPFVDRPKYLFVSGGRLREVHERIVPHLSESRRPSGLSPTGRGYPNYHEEGVGLSVGRGPPASRPPRTWTEET